MVFVQSGLAQGWCLVRVVVRKGGVCPEWSFVRVVFGQSGHCSWRLLNSVRGLVAEVLLYVHRNRRLIRDGSPGRPPPC